MAVSQTGQQAPKGKVDPKYPGYTYEDKDGYRCFTSIHRPAFGEPFRTRMSLDSPDITPPTGALKIAMADGSEKTLVPVPKADLEKAIAQAAPPTDVKKPTQAKV